MDVLNYIQTARTNRQCLLAVLVDPDKHTDSYPFLNSADLIFVGGSTGGCDNGFIQQLRTHTSKPIVLFPGNLNQICSAADALLFLSVMSSRNAELLIGQHIACAQQVKDSGLETIPMGYILIDGGTSSSVMKVSHSLPLAANDIKTITDTAIAAELLGKELVYLEAGSGAKNPVSIDIIRGVKHHINIPLIVGGGIRTITQMLSAKDAGADIVVIGNYFEQHAHEIPLFAQALHS